MNKIYTITKAACGAALLIALAACGNSGKDEAAKVKGTGLPKAGAATAGAPKIAYIEVDSLMTQYEFCKEYTLELTKRSENYQATINSRMQKLQNDVVAFQQKAQQGGYTPEEGQKAQARLQKQQEELQKLQEELTVKFDQEQQKYNQIMRDSIQEDQSLLASGIALTGANVAGKMERAEDGLLSARELCDMDLTGTELVVLSACQTAQGVVSDEGPAGLVRGLKRAGVKTVIATLWSVDDKATALFMKALYENWKVKKQDLYVAFRQAREALRNYKITKKVVLQRKTLRRVVVDCSKDPIYPYRSPYYWAPFVLID